MPHAFSFHCLARKCLYRMLTVKGTVALAGCFLLPIQNSQAKLIEVPLDEGIVFVMESQPFNAQKHDVSLCKKKDQPCIIDGKPAYGPSRSLPSIEVKSLYIKINGKRVDLDASGMFDTSSPLDDGRPLVWLSRELAGRLLVRAEFSEGVATYRVEWMIVGTSSLRTIIKCVECFAMAQEGFNAPKLYDESKNNKKGR